jgi:hypothetical protein
MTTQALQRMDDYRTLGRTGLSLSALDLKLPADAEQRLTEVSQPESTVLDHFFEPTMQGMIHGGVHVRRGIP